MRRYGEDRPQSPSRVGEDLRANPMRSFAVEAALEHKVRNLERQARLLAGAQEEASAMREQLRVKTRALEEAEERLREVQEQNDWLEQRLEYRVNEFKEMAKKDQMINHDLRVTDAAMAALQADYDKLEAQSGERDQDIRLLRRRLEEGDAELRIQRAENEELRSALSRNEVTLEAWRARAWRAQIKEQSESIGRVKGTQQQHWEALLQSHSEELDRTARDNQELRAALTVANRRIKEQEDEKHALSDKSDVIEGVKDLFVRSTEAKILWDRCGHVMPQLLTKIDMFRTS
mmetsp:Transcript_53804/g.122358  ORF Transcript_53804/g.122358 Transcript_53804/m.122358 type:complete len:290 (-) Transcript_53804:70-939(-)